MLSLDYEGGILKVGLRRIGRGLNFLLEVGHNALRGDVDYREA